MIHRHRTPSQKILPFLLYNGFQPRFIILTETDREKSHARPIIPGLRQPDTLCLTDIPKKHIGNLNQNACSISGIGLTSGSAPVTQVYENVQGVFYNPAGFSSLTVCNQSDPAGIVLLRGIIQSFAICICHIFHVHPPGPCNLHEIHVSIYLASIPFCIFALSFIQFMQLMSNKKRRIRREEYSPLSTPL